MNEICRNMILTRNQGQWIKFDLSSGEEYDSDEMKMVVGGSEYDEREAHSEV